MKIGVAVLIISAVLGNSPSLAAQPTTKNSTGATHQLSPDDSAYFTRADLSAAYSEVVGDTLGPQLAEAWFDLFDACVADDRVVSLPASFKLPALDPKRTACVMRRPKEKYRPVLQTIYGRRLVAIHSGLFTLVAGVRPDVKLRFDRLGVPYERRTVERPEAWAALMRLLKSFGNEGTNMSN